MKIKILVMCLVLLCCLSACSTVQTLISTPPIPTVFDVLPAGKTNSMTDTIRYTSKVRERCECGTLDGIPHFMCFSRGDETTDVGDVTTDIIYTMCSVVR